MHYVFARAVLIGTHPVRDLITALNIPGVAVELLIDLPLTFPESWHPAHLDLFEWRALVFPFYCLPFWWFAGLGIDGLLRKRILRWFALMPGTLLAAFFLTGALAGIFGTTAADRGDSKYDAMMCGVLLWTLLFAGFPASWIRNRRFRVVE